MSTTLYAHVEVKLDRTWHHFSAHAIHKNYLLAAAINGTRSDDLKPGREIPRPQARIHKMPEDATVITRACIAREVSANPKNICTLDANQIAAVQDELYRVRPEVKRTGIDEFDFEHSIFHTYINGGSIAGHSGFEDVRMICAFD